MSNEHREFLKKLKRREALTVSARLALFVVFLLLWEGLGRLGAFDPFIASSPVRVVRTVASLYMRHDLFPHVLTTFAETVAGFVSGTAIGVAFAVLLWFFPFLQRVLDPYLVVLNALPKIALGPILIVWVGAGPAAIIVMALLVSTVVTSLSVLSGFNESGLELERLMRSLGASRVQTFIKAVLPASVPTIMSALKISVGMSWVGVIVGEYLVSKRGLGYLIVYGGQVFKLDLVMASTVVLCIMATLMYVLVATLEKIIIKYKTE